MKSAPVLVKLPSRNDEPIAPVTIFDAEGRVLRVVPAEVFHPPGPAPRAQWHERRRQPRRASADRLEAEP
jgi:hypothetical protein